MSEKPRPFTGFGLCTMALLAGAAAMLWLFLRNLGDEPRGGPLGLLAASLFFAYMGLFWILRSEMPEDRLRHLGRSLGILTMLLYAIGLPLSALLLMLWLLAFLSWLRSGPALFLAWLDRVDRRGDRGGKLDV
jgi:hypothetical protein